MAALVAIVAVLIVVLLVAVSLLFYIPATSKVISGRLLTCDSVHSRWLYSVAPLGNQAISTMTWYPTGSHYPDIEPTNPWHVLISHWFDSTRVWTREFQIPRSPKMEDGWFYHPVWYSWWLWYIYWVWVFGDIVDQNYSSLTRVGVIDNCV